MNETLEFLVRHGAAVLFAAVFVEQLGVPLPAAPWMLAAGALAATGKINWFVALTAATIGSGIADLIWFYLGRYGGHRVVNLLCRISLEPDSCVRRTQDLFTRYGMRGVVAAKFIPGLSTLAPPLAGSSGVGAPWFFFFDGLGSLLYAGSFILLGALFSRQLEQVIAALASLGGSTLALVVGLAALYIGYKYYQRQRLLKELRMARITVDELHQKLESGESRIVTGAKLNLNPDPAKPALRSGCPSTARNLPHHEPTHPRPRPGGEQAAVGVLSVPLLGGVRGGFMVTMHARKRKEALLERSSRIVLVKRAGCHTRRGNRRWMELAACAAIFAIGQVMADNSSTNQPPLFKQLRYDESYASLRESPRRADWLDPIKFIPLNTNGSSYFTVGGEIRERYEYYRNSLWGRGPQDDSGYLLQRYMVHTDAHFGDCFRVFTQFKSGLEDGRNGGPRPTDRDDFDLNQAFFDVRASWSQTDSLTFRAGRQELAYGSSRLISAREAPNVRLSFDGVKAIMQVGDWRVDAFAVRPVRTKTGAWDDGPDPHQGFWGLYAVTAISWLPGVRVDLYYLGLDRKDAHFDQGTADEQRHSVGTRIWGRNGGWDYNLEFVYQFGSFGSGDIRAWTAASDAGFAFEKAPLKPRLGFKANVTSGDDNPNNAGLQTFNPLFPRGAYFGEPALIGPANHIDVHPQLDLAMRRNLTLTLAWDCFWRENTHDGIYGPAVNLIQSGRTSNASYVGNQMEMTLEWRFDRHAVITADYAHFFAGDFLKQTTPGKDVDYVSIWVTYRF